MKKVILLILALIATYFIAKNIFLNQNHSATLGVTEHQAANAPIATPTITQKTMQSGIPVRLVISKLHVDATVESVGLDQERKMDVPKVVSNVGWYELGAKPGTQGNAVIDGHYDTVTGAPTVFYYLGTLTNGDTITVYDDKNNTFNYTVTDVKKYDFDKFPLQQVFGSSSGYHLNLITCGGVWDKATKNYSQRTVVYSDLEK